MTSNSCPYWPTLLSLEEPLPPRQCCRGSICMLGSMGNQEDMVVMSKQLLHSAQTA